LSLLRVPGTHRAPAQWQSVIQGNRAGESARGRGERPRRTRAGRCLTAINLRVAIPLGQDFSSGAASRLLLTRLRTKTRVEEEGSAESRRF